MEQLDHRQLLSVNFTGNVATDFPASLRPGVVVLPNNPSVTHPTIAPDLADIVRVSGFDINGLRVSYTPGDDVLSVGIEQPASQQPGRAGAVIAGDSDNNGNDGTVAQAVLDVNPTFQDYPDFGGSEYMAAFLDLRGTGFADILAGYSINDARSPKQYQVAEALVNPALPPTVLPDFGTMLPDNTGNVYKVNSPSHPALEFAIDNFSELYLRETGRPLTPDSVIRMGAFAGSQEDTGIGEAFFPQQSFRLRDATIPPPVCPPVSPPIIINPHENRHINTAHPTEIRVNIIGSSGFDVTKIDPGTVVLGGAHPIFGFDRFINQDEFLDATFVFRGTDVVLPPGLTDATVTGRLTDGTTFSSTVKVFNRDRSFYTSAQNQAQRQRGLDLETRQNGFVIVPGAPSAADLASNATPIHVSYEPEIQVNPVPTVKIEGLRGAPARPVKVEGLNPTRPASVKIAGLTPGSTPSVRVEALNPGSGSSTAKPGSTRPNTPAPTTPTPSRLSSRTQVNINRLVRGLDHADLHEIAEAGAR